MENYEYSKVYPFDAEDEDDFSPDEAERIVEFIHERERELKANPRFVHPAAPAVFERTVAACEQIVKEFRGRLKAKIDYSSYSATIEMWCCYVDFDRGEFMSTLHYISKYAFTIRFEPLTSGELHIFIEMPYFISSKNFEGPD